MKFELDKYFERIGWQPGSESPYEQMKMLHRRHAMSIPFENMDIVMKKSISLAPDDLYEKIVLQKRGGYCFEMNALFFLALEAMGFEVRPYAARVCRMGTGYGGYSHRVNIVTLAGQRYVVDVGFGANCFIDPVLIEENLVQEQRLNTYRLVRSDKVDFAVQCLQNGEFSDMFGFNDRPAVYEDFEIGNYFASSHPRSFFVGNIVCVLATENGRYSLFNDTLTIIEGGASRKIGVTREQLPEVLRTYFNLEMDGISF